MSITTEFIRKEVENQSYEMSIHADDERLNEEILVSVHGTIKLENRNWKFGLHAFTRPKRLRCACTVDERYFNFGQSFLTIVLYSVAFDSDR